MNKLTAAWSTNMSWERWVIVRLNRVEVSGITRACEATGEVDCFVDDGRGGWRVADGRPQVQTLSGQVEISLRPDAPKWAWAVYWLARLGNPHQFEAGWVA